MATRGKNPRQATPSFQLPEEDIDALSRESEEITREIREGRNATEATRVRQMNELIQAGIGERQMEEAAEAEAAAKAAAEAAAKAEAKAEAAAAEAAAKAAKAEAVAAEAAAKAEAAAAEAAAKAEAAAAAAALTSEQQRVKDYMNSMSERNKNRAPPLPLLPQSVVVPPHYVPPRYYDKFNQEFPEYPDTLFASTTHMPGAPVSEKIRSRLGMGMGMGMGGGARKKKSVRQKKQRRRNRRRSTKKYRK